MTDSLPHNQTLSEDIWLDGCTHLTSSYCDEREAVIGTAEVSLLVIHNISLPPANNESDFNNQYVEDFFTGQLDSSIHPYFEQIKDIRVSSHLYIKRCGMVIQFVPLNKRAWHAGVSEFQGRTRCNDFSIGIELQGTDELDYTDQQYSALLKITKELQQLYPEIKRDNIVGHEHIAPGRKTDPGASFDWTRYKNTL